MPYSIQPLPWASIVPNTWSLFSSTGLNAHLKDGFSSLFGCPKSEIPLVPLLQFLAEITTHYKSWKHWILAFTDSLAVRRTTCARLCLTKVSTPHAERRLQMEPGMEQVGRQVWSGRSRIKLPGNKASRASCNFTLGSGSAVQWHDLGCWILNWDLVYIARSTRNSELPNIPL